MARNYSVRRNCRSERFSRKPVAIQRMYKQGVEGVVVDVTLIRVNLTRIVTM